MFSPPATIAGSKLPLSSSACKVQERGKSSCTPKALAPTSVNRNFDSSPIEDLFQVIDKSNSSNTTAVDTGLESKVRTNPKTVLPVEITKMQYDDLYLVVSKQKKDLQTLREFSDLEKEIWSEEEEKRRIENRDEQRMQIGKVGSKN